MVVLVTALALFSPAPADRSPAPADRSPARADRSPARAERTEALADFWDASEALTEALAALVVGTREATVASVAIEAQRVFFLNQGFSSGSGIREGAQEECRRAGLDPERDREASQELGGEGGTWCWLSRRRSRARFCS